MTATPSAPARRHSAALVASIAAERVDAHASRASPSVREKARPLRRTLSRRCEDGRRQHRGRTSETRAIDVLETVSRDRDERRRPEERSRIADLDRRIPEVHSIGPYRQRDIETIVDVERRAMLRADRPEPLGEPVDRLGSAHLVTQLEPHRSARHRGEHRFGSNHELVVRPPRIGDGDHIGRAHGESADEASSARSARAATANRLEG